MGREDVAEQLALFAEGRITLSDLRRWFTPLLVAETVEAVEADNDLVFRLAFLFEDDSVEERTHRNHANRLSRAMRKVQSDNALIELLPVIVGQNRFCGIAQKYLHGTISRVGFLSAVSESSCSRRLKDWLVATDEAGLTFFCETLSAGEYEIVGSIIGGRRDSGDPKL
jgi:hypothetical protein